MCIQDLAQHLNDLTQIIHIILPMEQWEVTFESKQLYIPPLLGLQLA